MRDGVFRGRRLVAVFDVAAGGAAERAARPTWCSLAAFYPEPLPDGLPSPAAAAHLDALEESLRSRLPAEGPARLVGAITTDGRHELVIYTAEAEPLRQLARALQEEFPELELQLTWMEDGEWTVFRQFVPALP